MALSEAARRRASALGVFGVAGGLFAWNLSRSWLYLTDDAFISLRYAARFAQGLGLTWNDGERVEGYSNLLWVLLLSVPSALGLDPVGAMVGLGLLSTAATFALLLRATGPLGRLGQGAAAFALALAAPLGVWTQAGLEGPLFTTLGLGAVVSLLPLLGAGPGPLLSPALGRAGLFLGLACLTRPDAPVLVAGLAAGLFLAGGQDRRALGRAALLAAIPALFTLAQLGFRLAYYDDWLPNTAHAKLDVASDQRLEAGLLYLWPWWKAGGALWGIALLGALCPPAAAPHLTRLLLPAILLWSAWVVRAGGDHFPAWRMLVVLEPLRALLAGAGLVGLWERLGGGRWVRPGRGLLLAAAIALGVAHWQAQDRDPALRFTRFDNWAHRLIPVGRLLHTLYASTGPLLATCAAGVVPFFAELPALDPLGLTDRHIARKKLHPGTVGMPGHEAGDTAYVLARQPDLVLVCAPKGGPHGCLPQETELLEHPDFIAQYQLSYLLAASGMTVPAGLHLRRDSPRVGLQRTADGLRIPAALLGVDKEHPAIQGADGRLWVERPAGGALVVGDLPALGDPLATTLRLEPPSAGWTGRIDVQPDGRWRLSIEAQSPLSFEALWVMAPR